MSESSPRWLTLRQVIINLSIIIAVLSVFLIASQLTDEVNWSLTDFIVGFLLLSSFSLAITIIRNRMGENKYLKFVIAMVLFIFLATWVELAVGIFS